VSHCIRLTFAGLLAIAGCARRAPEEAAAPPPRPESALAEVHVAAQVLAGCSASAAAADFTVDIAYIGPPGDDVLKQLARCLASGPLAGRKIRLVTWTAVRPPDRDVARVEGLRGFAVRDYLVFHGVARASIDVELRDTTTSAALTRGSLDERRVDIDLAPGTPE